MGFSHANLKPLRFDFFMLDLGLIVGIPDNCRLKFCKSRRSLAVIPPQIPHCSSLSKAYCRHISRTGHCLQIAIASFLDLPFSG